MSDIREDEDKKKETKAKAADVAEDSTPTENAAPTKSLAPTGSGDSNRNVESDGSVVPAIHTSTREREYPRETRERGGDESRGEYPDARSRGGRYRVYYRKKVCKFCSRKIKINYLESEALRRFTTNRGKILPRRITGTCAKHQRQLSNAIKRARVLALLPFVAK